MKPHKLGLGVVFLLCAVIEAFGDEEFPTVDEKYSYERFTSDALRFKVDSPRLEAFLTGTTVMDQSKPVPHTFYETVDTRYACGQIAETLEQSNAAEAYFIRLSNDIPDFEVIQRILTQPPESSSAPQTLCLITLSSDLFYPQLDIDFKLTKLKTALGEKNVANVRVIIVIEKGDGTSHPRSLAKKVKEKMFDTSSDSTITDGSFTLLPDSLTSALTEPAFMLNGNKISLQQLYGRLLPDAEHFDPGTRMIFDLEEGEIMISKKVEAVSNLHSGGVYIDRHLPTWPSPTTLLISGTDTSSTITTHIIYETINTMVPTIHAMYGEAGSGKTVSLHRVLSDLQTRAPTTWSIKIDVAKTYPPKTSPISLTVDKFVENAVDAKVRGLFKNVLEVNPRKVVLLLDGLDQLTPSQESTLIETVSTLAKKGVNIVLAGSLRTMELLQTNEDLKMFVYHIPDMTVEESTSLLTDIWLDKVRNLPSTSTAPLEERLDLYAKGFIAKVLEKSIPTTPLTLTVLAEAFSENSLQYVFATDPNEPIIFPGLESITDRHSMYEKFSASIQAITTYDSDSTYALVAFKQSVAERRTVDWMGGEFRTSFEELIRRAEDRWNGDPTVSGSRNIKNIMEHSDVQHFFAGKYVKTLLTQNSLSWGPLSQSLLQDPTYEGVLKYAEQEMQRHLRIPEMNIFQDEDFNGATPEAQKVMRNLIDLGLDHVHAFVYEMLTPEQRSKLTNFYINEEIEAFKPRRTFGALTLREYSDMDLLELPLEKIRCSVLCKMVETSMVKSLMKLHAKGQWYQQSVERNNAYYLNMLEIAVTRPTPNLEMVEFLVDHIPPLPNVNYNHLLVRTIGEVGKLCRPIAEYLVQKGAKPAEAAADDEGVLTAAVKWAEKDVLQYVVEELHVDVDNRLTTPDKSAMAVAFEANPSPYYTMPGWWEMIQYLVNNVEQLDYFWPPNPQPVHALPEEVKSKMFKLMMSDFTRIDNKYALASTSSELSNTEMTRLMRYVTSNLRPETKRIRRTLLIEKIFAKHIGGSLPSTIELLLYNRGIGPMSSSDRHFYESTLSHLLTFFPPLDALLTSQLKTRIGVCLMNNINDVEDFQSVEKFISADLVQTPNEKVALINALDRRMLLSTANVQRQPASLGERLSMSRIEYDPSISGPAMQKEYEQLKNAIKMHGTVMEIDNSDDGTYVTHSKVNCLRSNPMAGCRISWQIVDEVNDATTQRSIKDIRINTEKLLKKLDELQIDRVAFKQMIEFSRELLASPGGLAMFTGNARMAVMELLRANNINTLRHNQITAATVDEVIIVQAARINIPTASPDQPHLIPGGDNALRPAHEPTRLILPNVKIRSELYYTRRISAMSLGKQLVSTFASCILYLTADGDGDVKSCAIGAGGAVKTIVIDVGGSYAAQLVPITIRVYTPLLLKIMPSSTPTAVTKFLKAVQSSRGLAKVSKSFGITLGVIGIAFDAYVIGNSVLALVECHKTTSACTGRDKAELYISLTFATLSIVLSVVAMFVPGGAVAIPLIQLALAAIEGYVQGFNNVIYYFFYYHTSFNENLLMFYSTLYGFGVPAAVKSVEERQDRLDSLEDRATEYLAQSNENIVAFATGIGMKAESSWTANYTLINMGRDSEDYTSSLSRIQPKEAANTTKLCLPEYVSNAAWFEWVSDKVPSARYRCIEGMVIANKTRIEDNTKRGKQIIFYNLIDVNKGHITGSSVYNNMFVIFNGTRQYFIKLDTEAVDNYLTFMTRYFYGSIYLNGKSNHETALDFSKVQSVVYFKWNHTTHDGIVKLGRNPEDSMLIVKENGTEPNLRFVGSSRHKDIFVCDYHKDYRHGIKDRFITVDGGGGHGAQPYQLDEVIDCQNTIVKPWTLMMGTYDKDVIYSAYIIMNNTNPQSSPDSTSHSRLLPKKSQYLIHFYGGHSILTRTVRVLYMPSNDTLMWEFWDTESTTMKLFIEPYRSPQALGGQVDEKAEGLQTIFVDRSTGATIYPVVDLTQNQTEPFAISQFSLFMTATSNDSLALFNSFMGTDDYKKAIEKFAVQVKYTSRSNNATAVFGSINDDKILLDNTVAVADGGGGSDYYIWSKLSPNRVTIHNYDPKRAVDTLIIVDKTCQFVTTLTRTAIFQNRTFDETRDLIIQCTMKGRKKWILLVDYKTDSSRRHLHIFWNNKEYVPLEPNWTGGENYAEVADAFEFSVVPRLAMYFSFGEDYKGEVMTVTSEDRILMINMTDYGSDSLSIFRSGPNDLVIALKFLTESGDMPYLILKDIIANQTLQSSGEREYAGVLLSEEYLGFTIIFVNSTSDSTIGYIWHTADIFINIKRTSYPNGDVLLSDLVQEYHVDLNEEDKSDVVIDRIGTEPKNDEYRAGVLSIYGSQPKDFEVKWMDHDTSLALCAHQRCVVIKNWCDSLQNRLSTIAFISKFYREAILMRYLYELDCQFNQKGQVLPQLEERLAKAQKRWELAEKIGDDDIVRAKKCLMLTFAEHVHDESIYRIFGFTSFLEQKRFMMMNCKKVMTADRLGLVSHADIMQLLIDTFEIFKSSDDQPSANEQQYMVDIETNLAIFNGTCWDNFKGTFDSKIYSANSDSKRVRNHLHWQKQREINYQNCIVKNPTIEHVDSKMENLIKRCMMVVYAQRVCDKPIYRILGFTSFMEQKNFMQLVCPTRGYVEIITRKIQYDDIRQLLVDTFKTFESSNKPTALERLYMTDIRNHWEISRGDCWKFFSARYYVHRMGLTLNECPRAISPKTLQKGVDLARVCIVLTFAELIHNETIYRIFGFSARLEHIQFMINCEKVVTPERVHYLEYDDTKRWLENTFDEFQSSNAQPTAQERTYMADIRKSFAAFNQGCWAEFIRSFNLQINNKDKYDMILRREKIVKKCSENPESSH